MLKTFRPTDNVDLCNVFQNTSVMNKTVGNLKNTIDVSRKHNDEQTTVAKEHRSYPS